MNLLHLHYFYVVAKEQGFTNASRALNIQQPAISRMVKLLEEDIGFPLFEKIGRNVSLTKKGAEVFEHCKTIFGAVDDLKQSLGGIDGECKGPLLFGASEPIASHFIPSVLKPLLAAYPLVYPNMYAGTSSMLFESIAKGSVELGIFFHIPELPEKLEIFQTKDIPFHLVIRKDLRRNKQVLETFIGSREIDDTSTKKFPTLDRLRKDYPAAKIKISTNNLTAHRSLVLEGLGVSILPRFLVEQDLAKGSVVDIYPKESFNFKMKFVKRKTAVLSINALKLVEMCLEKGAV